MYYLQNFCFSLVLLTLLLCLPLELSTQLLLLTSCFLKSTSCQAFDLCQQSALGPLGSHPNLPLTSSHWHHLGRNLVPCYVLRLFSLLLSQIQSSSLLYSSLLFSSLLFSSLLSHVLCPC